MKIGILTLFDTTSEGGIAQAMVLKEFLQRRPSAKVEIAQYYSQFRKEKRSNHPMVDRARSLIFPISPPLFDSSSVSEWASRKDLIIIGSDEVWKYPDPVFFGDLSTITPIATYAACSPDNVTLDQKFSQPTVNQLRVSVRDRFTKENAKASFGMEYEIVCDPVVLLAKPCASFHPTGNAILAYNHMARKTRAKLGDKYEVVDIYAQMKTGPMKSLAYWQTAPYSSKFSTVVTAGFHPTLMAILAGKPVISFDRRTKTKELVCDFFGPKYALNSLDELSPELVESACLEFDLDRHNQLLMQLARSGRRFFHTLGLCETPW